MHKTAHLLRKTTHSGAAALAFLLRLCEALLRDETEADVDTAVATLKEVFNISVMKIQVDVPGSACTLGPTAVPAPEERDDKANCTWCS